MYWPVQACLAQVVRRVTISSRRGPRDGYPRKASQCHLTSSRRRFGHVLLRMPRRRVCRAMTSLRKRSLYLWKKYSHLDSEADLVPLAFSICSRKIHEARRIISHTGAALPQDLPSPQTAPEQRLIDIEVRDRLKRAVLNLSKRCKELIRLRLLGRSTAEIAQALNTRPATTSGDFNNRKGIVGPRWRK